MNIKEKGLNLFSELKTVNPDSEIVKYFDTDILDKWFNNNHTRNKISPAFETMSNSEIATLINSIYGKKWDNLINGYINAENAIVKLGDSEVRTENLHGTSKNNGDSTHKVSAFNDDEFSNNDKTENSGNGETTGDNKITIERTNNNTVVNTFEFLQNVDLYDSINTDICNVLFLQIYED